jgi:tripartite-type tricarboxylate transporter receptor subunit TctC
VNQTLSRLASLPLIVGVSVIASLGFAQNYPNKPIRMLLPFPPGGGTDALGRVVVPKLAEAMGQPIVIDNRAGAGGNMAAETVARSAADGYTLLLGSSTVMTTSKSLYHNLAFDPIADFAPITQLATAANILVVHPSVAARSVSELIAIAKAKPRTLNYASAGVGSPMHLAAELFRTRAGIDIVHVPYKGGVPAATSVLAGETQLLCGSIASSLQYARVGRLRGLAVTSLKRSPLAPDLPTLDESGLAGFNMQAWGSIEAPAGTPANVIARVHDEAARVLAMPDVQDLLHKVGYTATGTTAEQLAEIKRAETAMWAKVIKDANIRAE